MARHYGAHREQRTFIDDAAPFRAAIAGIGGGKTEVAAFDGVRHCLRYPGGKLLVIAPSFRMLERSTRRVVRKVLRWWPGITWEEVKSENRIFFPCAIGENGEPSEIWFAHAQDAEQLRGPDAAWFFIDEAALCKEDVFLVAQGRIRQPGYSHRGWIATTPKGQNWVYRRFVQDRESWPPEKQANYSFHTWPTHDNPLYLYEPEYLSRLEESYGVGTDFYRQELLASFITLAGLVYAQFDRGKHCVAAVPGGVFDEVLAGIDWGLTSPGCIIVIGRVGECWYVIDEVYERGRILPEWEAEAKQLLSRWKVRRFFADPEDANAIETFRRAGLPIEKADNKRIPGVRAVQSAIAGGRLKFVEPACPNLLAEMGQYHWRETADGKPIEDQDPAKEFDHAMDALRYAEMGIPRAYSQTTVAAARTHRGR